MRCCPKRRVDIFHEPERDAGSSGWSKASGQPRILLLTIIHVQLACCSTIPTLCLTVITSSLLGKQHIAVNFSLVLMYCIFKMVGGQDKTQRVLYCQEYVYIYIWCRAEWEIERTCFWEVWQLEHYIYSIESSGFKCTKLTATPWTETKVPLGSHTFMPVCKVTHLMFLLFSAKKKIYTPHTHIQHTTFCHWQHYKKYLHLLVEVEDKCVEYIYVENFSVRKNPGNVNLEHLNK